MNSDHDHVEREIDREIDIALLRYGAAEPRTGLEDRVLANLRMPPQSASAHSWWRWTVVVAGAAMAIVLAVWIVFPPGRKHLLESTDRPSSVTPRIISSAPVVTAKPPSVTKRSMLDRGSVRTTASSESRLDQFPSPQPLSEQEKSLQNYVAEYPGHASLMAQARIEALQRDLAEEAALDAPSTKSSSQ